MAFPPAAPPAKISDKLAALSAAGRVSVSYEFFPPKTDEGVRNLIDDLERSRHLIRPTFVSLTHRSAAAHSEERWLGIGSQIQHRLGVDVLLHLTCHKPKAGTFSLAACSSLTHTYTCHVNEDIARSKAGAKHNGVACWR